MALDTSVIAFGLPIILVGLLHTTLFCTISIASGFLLAWFLALCRISRHRFLRSAAQVYLEIFRNTPFLVQAFTVYFIFPKFGLRLDATTAGILVLTMYAGANMSESIRGAILSVPKGQMQAARALGMSHFTAMRRIVFPQMLGYLLPSLTNQVIGLIKESAALSVISVPEMSMAGQIVLGESFSPVETYIMIAVLYWVLTAAVATGMRALEHSVVLTPARQKQLVEHFQTTES
jgi:His/Glu/Gln/Arg/opine family amino acid ABC transporter permease subunit